MKNLNYYFTPITQCNMCGDDTTHHKILGQRLNGPQGLRPKRRKGISITVMRCRNCGLIYTTPQPIPHDIQDHYGVPPDEYWKPEYFVVDPAYFSGAIAKAKELISFQNGMKAMDVGAGIGKCMISLQNAGFDAYGFEPSTPFYENAIRNMGISPDKLKNGKIEDVDYSPGSFDFITFGAVLEHLYDPDAAIAKAMSWLKPNGIIHIEVPSSRHLISRMFNFYYRLAGTNYVTNTSPMHSPFHMHEFTLKSFEYNRQKNNFAIAFHQYYVCDIVGIPRIFHAPLRAYMKWTNTGMQLEVWVKKTNNVS